VRRAAVSLAAFVFAALAGCLLPDLSVYTGAITPTDGPPADAGSFCAGKTTAFCADFDEGNLLTAWVNGTKASWTSTDIDPSGSLTLDGTRSVSAPAALFAALPRRGDVNQSPVCFLILGVNGFNDPVPPFHVHYDNVTVEKLP
jgi:hypothetical protein